MPVQHCKAEHVLDIARYSTLAQHNLVVAPSDLGYKNTELMFSIGLGFQTQKQHRNTTSSVIDESLSKWFTAGLRFCFPQQYTRKKLVEEVGRWMVSQIVQRKIENEVMESVMLVFLY
jgi:hypothetical protein